MFKKTVLAAAVTLAFATAVPSAQAGTLSSMLGGLFNGHDSATTSFEARRGGFRSSRFSRSSSSTSSSRAVAPANNTTSSTTSNTNRTTTNNTNNQQDAQFSQNAYRGTNTTNTGTVGNGMATSRPGYGQQGYAQGGNMGMGSSFLSSLAGASAGVLLANMLLSPSAAAAQGTEQATPDMLSDQQLTECLDQLKLDLADAESRLADASDEEKAAIRDEISQMHNLQITLMSEQLNRLKGATEAASAS